MKWYINFAVKVGNFFIRAEAMAKKTVFVLDKYAIFAKQIIWNSIFIRLI